MKIGKDNNNMNEEEILNFKNQIKDYSLEQLKEEKLNLDEKITKMIFDSDLMVKLAIITTKIESLEKHV